MGLWDHFVAFGQFQGRVHRCGGGAHLVLRLGRSAPCAIPNGGTAQSARGLPSIRSLHRRLAASGPPPPAPPARRFVCGEPEPSREDSVRLLLQRGRACFDAAHYKTQWKDLGHLTTPKELWLHYVRHGQFEGRTARYDEGAVGLCMASARTSVQGERRGRLRQSRAGGAAYACRTCAPQALRSAPRQLCCRAVTLHPRCAQVCVPGDHGRPGAGARWHPHGAAERRGPGAAQGAGVGAGALGRSAAATALAAHQRERGAGGQQRASARSGWPSVVVAPNQNT